MKKLILIALIALNGAWALAESKVSPGSCGTMGCSAAPTQLQLVAGMTNHPYFQNELLKEGSLKGIEIEYFAKDNPEMTIIVTSTFRGWVATSYRCAKVEYSDIPFKENGNETVRIADAWVMFTFKEGRCNL